MLFGNPQLLYLLWALPALWILALVGESLRRRRTARWGDAPLWTRLSPARSTPLRWTRFLVATLALGLAMVAAARPQVGARLVQVERQGVDVVVALDVSLSMQATDVVPSRMGRSKQEIRELFGGLRGNRMAVVLFSGSSFLLCPLTVDAVAGNLFLDAVEVDVLPDPGTNLEEAIRGGMRAFGDDEHTGRGRAMVLFTDGEGHDGDPLAAAREAAEQGIPILTVGVGTPSGEPIPVRDSRGRVTGYKKDRAGSVVLSRLDEDVLGEIARLTRGEYYPATLQGHEVGEILDYMDRLEKGELGEAFRRRVEERFQIPLGLALVLLALALLTPEGRRIRSEEGVVS